MTDEQRSWCVDEIDRAIDPMLRPPRWRVLSYSDRELATAVDIAWIDRYQTLKESDCHTDSQNRQSSHTSSNGPAS